MAQGGLLLRNDYVAGRTDLLAPHILPFEVLNALKYSGAFGEDELIEAAQTLDDLQLTLVGLGGEYVQEACVHTLRPPYLIFPRRRK